MGPRQAREASRPTLPHQRGPTTELCTDSARTTRDHDAYANSPTAPTITVANTARRKPGRIGGAGRSCSWGNKPEAAAGRGSVIGLNGRICIDTLGGPSSTGDGEGPRESDTGGLAECSMRAEKALDDSAADCMKPPLKRRHRHRISDLCVASRAETTAGRRARSGFRPPAITLGRISRHTPPRGFDGSPGPHIRNDSGREMWGRDRTGRTSFAASNLARSSDAGRLRAALHSMRSATMGGASPRSPRCSTTTRPKLVALNWSRHDNRRTKARLSAKALWTGVLRHATVRTSSSRRPGDVMTPASTSSSTRTASMKRSAALTITTTLRSRKQAGVLDWWGKGGVVLLSEPERRITCGQD